MRCAVKGGVWFVETDVSVASQPQNLHVLCVVLQKLMVSCTFLLQVACQTVGQMGVFLRQIHLVEQVAVHKMYVTLLVVFSQSDIFVEVDCFHLLERKFLLTAKLRQNFVQSQRGGTRCQTQNGGRFFPHNVGYNVGGNLAHFLIIFHNLYFHFFTSCTLIIFCLPLNCTLPPLYLQANCLH